ncbi:hypothetical protein LV779_02370 [Streptomyces thinghirensis]|nr:hypothetical protein [Streptomyces thinghirensis]
MFPGRNGDSYGIINTNRLLTGGGRRGAVPGADRHQERLHQQRRQHTDRGRPPRRANPGGDGDEPAGGRRPRRVRGRPARCSTGASGRPGTSTRWDRWNPGRPAAASAAGRTRRGRGGAAPGEDAGWPETGAIVGVAGLGAGAMALALRLKLVRVEKS